MGHGHAHAHGPGGEDELELPRTSVVAMSVMVAVLAVLTLGAIVVLRSTGDTATAADEVGLTSDRYDADIVAIEVAPCSYDPSGSVECRTVTVEPTQGPDAGDRIDLPEETLTATDLLALEVGDDIVVGYESQTDTYFFADRQRRPTLYLLTGLFALAVILLGRRKGLAALGGLVLSIVVLLQFVVPAILDGHDPVLVGLTGSVAIAFFALYLAHGVTPLTSVALLGTVGALAVTVVLAQVFFELAQFSGLADEEAFYLRLAAAQVDPTGLLLAGVVIGALGALDDMTVTQASTVWALHDADPGSTRRQLFERAMVVGRDHVSSTVNTLLLAYTGASMPLLLLFVLSEQSLGSVANSETVAVEIVRTLVGSIGLLVAVPLTTALAIVAVLPRGHTGEVSGSR